MLNVSKLKKSLSRDCWLSSLFFIAIPWISCYVFYLVVHDCYFIYDWKSSKERTAATTLA